MGVAVGTVVVEGVSAGGGTAAAALGRLQHRYEAPISRGLRLVFTMPPGNDNKRSKIG